MYRMPQRMAVVSIPALAVGLLLGLLMIVGPFSSRYLHAQGQAAQIGQLRLASDEAGQAGDFILELEQMEPAPAGEHYELWMQSDAGELLRLSEFAVDEGGVTLAGSSEEDLLGEYSRVLISLEPDDDPDEATLTQVVLSSTLPSQLLTLTRQLLIDDAAGDSALFGNLQAQIAIASEENDLLVEALAVDEFAEVRRHAEHIVNILDGDSGVFFGDLDRDGQVQNPGDGVGIRVYFEQAHDITLEILAVVSDTGELDTQAQEIISQLEESQLLVEQAREQARKVFAADTKAESVAISESLDALFAELTDTLATTYAASLGLAAYPFYAASGTSGVDVVAELEEAAQIGQLRLVGNETGQASDFILELEQMEPAPAGEHYELWMQSDAGELLQLGEFAVDEGSATLVGSTGENLLGEYSSALISLEPDDDPDEAALTQVVLSSTLPSQLLTLTRQLVADDTAGDLTLHGNLQAQIAIFSEHCDFFVDALVLNDETEVRRHAEHIVNILDGESGVFFGDLDRDGQVQNPGDGVGIRVYLEQAHDIALEILAVVSDTEELDTQTQEIIILLEESQLLVEQARERALNVFGITAELELLSTARDLVQSAALLTATAEQARDIALTLVVYEFYTPPASSTVNDSSLPDLSTPEVIVLPPVTATVGETWTHPLEGAHYVYVPGGEVTLGTNTDDLTRAMENPQHTVEVEAFWMGQTEVTNRRYRQCVDQGACTPPNNSFWQEAELAKHPVTHVNWDQANAYARWAGGRLPTEAEWESACQGPAEQEYPWGDTEPTEELSNYLEHVGNTVAVGSYPEGASPYGLLDMSGNVWEWTSSLDQLYPYEAEDGREDLVASGIRVGRGGSFSYSEQYVRCAARLGFNPAWQIPHLGIRVVLTETE